MLNQLIIILFFLTVTLTKVQAEKRDTSNVLEGIWVKQGYDTVEHVHIYKRAESLVDTIGGVQFLNDSTSIRVKTIHFGCMGPTIWGKETWKWKQISATIVQFKPRKSRMCVLWEIVEMREGEMRIKEQFFELCR